MAAIEDLIAQVADPDLRMRLQAAVRALKEHKRFGLVFEEHIPAPRGWVGTRSSLPIEEPWPSAGGAIIAAYRCKWPSRWVARPAYPALPPKSAKGPRAYG